MEQAAPLLLAHHAQSATGRASEQPVQHRTVHACQRRHDEQRVHHGQEQLVGRAAAGDLVWVEAVGRWAGGWDTERWLAASLRS